MPRIGPSGRFCCARLPFWLRANSGSSEATFTSFTQSFMHSVPCASGLPCTRARPCAVVKPLRFGICTLSSVFSFSS